MARYSDQELQDLKARANAAMGNGSHLARAEEFVVDLIEELQALRKNGAGSESTPKVAAPAPEPAPEPVKAAEPAPAPVEEDKFEDVREALEEGEASPVSEDYSVEKVLAKVEEAPPAKTKHHSKKKH